MRLDALVRAFLGALLVFLAALALLVVSRREQAPRSDDLGSWWLSPEGESDAGEDLATQRLKAVEAVPFGGRLVASVPRDFDRWRWATDGDMTLLVHGPRGGVETVLWAEAIRPSQWPSLELERFHREVAPLLARRGARTGPGPFESLMTLLVQKTELERGAVRGALTRLLGRTLGRGLGFHASPQRFRGWRTLRAGDIELRLTRIEGKWGSPAPVDPDLHKVVAALAELSPLMADLDRQLDRGTPVEGSRSASPAPAHLVLGQAGSGPGSTFHFAILCRIEPRCDAASDLVEILRSLRRPEAGELESLAHNTEPSRLRILAREVGWSLRSDEQRLTAEDLRRLDRWLAEQEGLEAPGG